MSPLFTMVPVPKQVPPPSAGSMVTQHGLSPFQRQGDQSSDSRPASGDPNEFWRQKKCVA